MSNCYYLHKSPSSFNNTSDHAPRNSYELLRKGGEVNPSFLNLGLKEKREEKFWRGVFFGRVEIPSPK